MMMMINFFFSSSELSFSFKIFAIKDIDDDDDDDRKT